MKYLLIDSNNMFKRCAHAIKENDPEQKASMALHLTFNSIRKAWRMFDVDHVIFTLDGRSWRKEIYPKYKANRIDRDLEKTEQERQDDKVFYDTLNDLIDYFRRKTNCTVLYNEIVEADDLIARFIQRHPDDHHIIVSSDSDFRQLITPKVSIYDGMKQERITAKGWFDEKDNPVYDSKGKILGPPDPEWLLFEKCIRGDASDNIFSAYPRVRKNILMDAFDDRKSQGFSWNNLMLQEWDDHEGVKHRVRDDYERNVMLIDLTKQPPEIITLMDSVIDEAVSPTKASQIGTHFLKFCGKWNLDMISKSSKEFAEILGHSYEGVLR